jgi:hypothetical protein
MVSIVPGSQTIDEKGTASDVYAVGVTVVGDDGGTGSAPASVTVNNVAPVITGVTGPALVIPGNPANVSGTFTDVGTLDGHTVSINWGDGNTTAGVVVGSGGSGSFAGSHTYAIAQDYTITVALSDDDTGTVSAPEPGRDGDGQDDRWRSSGHGLDDPARQGQASDRTHDARV